jgi:hypothetical protein
MGALISDGRIHMRRFVGVAFLVVVMRWPWASPGEPVRPEVPTEIAVPPGHKLLAKLQAKGVQVYKAVAAKSGQLAWAFEAPLADLVDGQGGKAGYHYEGPTWEAIDGSMVIWDKAEKINAVQAPNSKEDIPWLLIKVKAAGGKAGAFSPVVFVQRLQTAGGKSPVDAPQRAGTKIGVVYRADYYFYCKAE